MPIYSYAELKGKIKVGDKVRAAEGKHNGCEELGDSVSVGLSNGIVGKITQVDDYSFSINNCRHGYHSGASLELLTEEKTLDTVDVGDVVVNKDGEEITVLDKSPNGTILFLSRIGRPTCFGAVYTCQEMQDHGITVKQSTSAPKEMTLEEVSKTLGYPVKIVE